VAEALRHVRRAKSERKLSMKAPVAEVEIRADDAILRTVAAATDDLSAAGRIGRLTLVPTPGEQMVVACTF
jgi:valyl-tRNA synthetase